MFNENICRLFELYGQRCKSGKGCQLMEWFKLLQAWMSAPLIAVSGDRMAQVMQTEVFSSLSCVSPPGQDRSMCVHVFAVIIIF